MKLAVITICCLLISCNVLWRTAGIRREMLPKDQLLSFSIAIDSSQIGNKTPIRLKIMNITEQVLYIADPQCFGVNIMPFAEDDNELTLQTLFRIKAACNERRSQLEPGTTLNTLFRWSVEDCFDISHLDKYRLHFEYRGNVYDSVGRNLSTEAPIRSNKLTIE